MSDENTTHFQFTLGRLSIELSGEKEFVERAYKMLMADVEAARALRGVPLPEPIEASEAEDDNAEPVEPRKIVWVHRCSEMMHKIYMSTANELSRNKFFRLFDLEGVNVVYTERDAVEAVLPGIEKGLTLWAELTSKGRQKIAEAQADGRDGTI